MFSNAGELAQLIEHTVVRPDATIQDIADASAEAKRYGFAVLVVSGCHVLRAREFLAGTPVKVGTVVGFPHGANTTTVKIVEAMEALKNGIDELDIVINIGLVKSGRYDLVEIDLKNIIVLTPKVIHKVIIETGHFNPEEIGKLSKMVSGAGAEFIKTCSGYGPRGATVDDVRLIRNAVGPACRIKAAGGIRDLATATALIEAGAERIGTSSSPAIMHEYETRQKA